MDTTQIPNRRSTGWIVILACVFVALLLTLSMVEGLAAQPGVDEGLPAASPGGQDASGDEPSGEEPVDDAPATESVTTTIESGQEAALSVTESVSETVTGTVTETVGITISESIDASTTSTYTLHFPLVIKPLPKLAISGTRANSSNQWQVYWQDAGPGHTYRIQESQQPNFSVLTLDESLSAKSKDISHGVSAFSTYYYRVRLETGGQIGPWSDRLAVAGAYHDSFSDPSTGWTMRRTTYLEGTTSWYGAGENAGNFIIVVADRWDWMIASPLQAAPKPPYVIEYRARVHDASNLVSGGVVLGGDWNFQACPEFGNIYQTDNCFNHFYNFNYIHYGAMKLLFEQIDQLLWCPTCGGSPIKRLGNENNWREIDPIFPNSTARDWHTYKIEVRESGISLSIDGTNHGSFGSPAYVNDPFFGVFASTDEYKPSIWFFDYFKVTPLDS